MNVVENKHSPDEKYTTLDATCAVMDWKMCVTCLGVFSIERFSRDRKRKDGRRSYCKECAQTASKAWAANNRERYNQWARDYRKRRRKENRDQYLSSRYGLSAAEYDQRVVDQNGRCLICRTKPDQLVVDHCHHTGVVRGLLCGNCNIGIGNFQESVEVLDNAARYVAAWT